MLSEWSNYNILIFPLVNIILYFTPINRKLLSDIVNCIQASLLSISAIIYSLEQKLFISYQRDTYFVRYMEDSYIQGQLDLMIGYLLSDIIISYNQCNAKNILIHHIVGSIALLAIRYTGYGYLFGLYFMITEITTPFLMLSKYTFDRDLIDNRAIRIYRISVCTLYFLIRIMPIPYLLFLVFQILLHQDEHRLMTLIAVFSIPIMASINIIWFLLILKKYQLVSKLLKMVFILIYTLFCIHLIWSIKLSGETIDLLRSSNKFHFRQDVSKSI